MHGYHGLYHLSAMLRYEAEKARDTEYIATILWSIGRLVGGTEYPMPGYEEFVRPKPQDVRTKKEIVNNLIEKLRKGVTVNDGAVSSSGEDGS